LLRTAAIYTLVPPTPKNYGTIFIYSIGLPKKKAEIWLFQTHYKVRKEGRVFWYGYCPPSEKGGLPVDECENGNYLKLQRKRVLLRRIPPAEALRGTDLAVGLHVSGMKGDGMLVRNSITLLSL
jgi:hypothetical protein